MKRAKAPDRGDLVWLTFDPQTGREQRGRRPALVLSPRTYNERAELAIVCPITSHMKGYPFEVALPDTGPVSGVVLSDQVKSIDWKEREAEVIGRVDDAVLEEVRKRIRALLGT